jgi:hypothetical protein
MRNKEFVGIPKQRGKIEINFDSCSIDALILENTENISFDDISISFRGCLIRNVVITEIETQNVSINFFSCLISGRINTPNLKSVSLNNCFLTDSLFLSNLNRVRVALTAENVFPILWRKLLKTAKIDPAQMWKSKQSYHVYDVADFSYISNYLDKQQSGISMALGERHKPFKYVYYLSEKEKNSLNISLSLSYKNSAQNADVQILKSQIKSLSLTDIAEGKVIVESCIIDNQYFSGISGSTELQLYNVKPRVNSGNFSIHQCNLDKSWFDNVDFKTYSKFSFYRSKFSKQLLHPALSRIVMSNLQGLCP